MIKKKKSSSTHYEQARKKRKIKTSSKQAECQSEKTKIVDSTKRNYFIKTARENIKTQLRNKNAPNKEGVDSTMRSTTQNGTKHSTK